jgi:hypothetical protein
MYVVYTSLNLRRRIVAISAAEDGRPVAADQLAAAGENRRPIDQARPLPLNSAAPEGQLTRRFFGAVLQRIAALPLPAG